MNYSKYQLVIKTPLFILILVCIGNFCSCVDNNKTKTAGVSHIVVIGFDGLSPDGLKKANTPTFDRLIKEGASTMHARAVLPTSSSPNWASMIMGAGPEQHGITSNDWKKDNFTLPAVVQGESFLFPTIFHLVDKQKDSAEIGAIYHWAGFGRLFEKDAVDFDESPSTAEQTAAIAINYLNEHHPNFTFIHFDHVDHAGHEYGHGSEQYYRSVTKADSLLGAVMASIESSPMKDSAMVVVCSDHGGLGKGHGGESLQEVEVPFLLWGANVKRNYKIKYPVYQYDNAATAAFAMNLDIPKAWVGRPITEAFKGFEINDDFPVSVLETAPIFDFNNQGYESVGGLFSEKSSVRILSNTNTKEVRFTLDGSMPNANSTIYEKDIKIENNTVIKAAGFKQGKINSLVSEAHIRIRPKNKIPPVNYQLFYLNNLSFLPSLASKTPSLVGKTFEITSAEIKNKVKANTALRFHSIIEIPEKAEYTFYTRSDDGSKLLIDGKQVVDNDGDHGVREKSGKIILKEGKHTIEVLWFNGGGDGWLDVYFESQHMPKQILPTTMLLSI